jgi:hypothetical protein
VIITTQEEAVLTYEHIPTFLDALKKRENNENFMLLG